MKFTVYNTATGEVKFGGMADEPTILARVGETVLLGQEFNSGYISNGEHHDLPPSPSPTHVFDYSQKQWVDPRSLEQVRADKNARINAARLRANQSTFTFAGKQIAVDPLSRSDIDGAHGAWLLTGGPPPGWPGGWKAVDNSIVPIPDMATWAAFYGTMVATGTANFNHAQVLKAQLAAATTIAEVESVPDW